MIGIVEGGDFDDLGHSLIEACPVNKVPSALHYNGGP